MKFDIFGVLGDPNNDLVRQQLNALKTARIRQYTLKRGIEKQYPMPAVTFPAGHQSFGMKSFHGNLAHLIGRKGPRLVKKISRDFHEMV